MGETLRAFGSVIWSGDVAESQTNPRWDVLLDLGAAGTGTRNERLKRALRAAIRSGRLATGATLPPSRALAADLGCSRWVVTEAYAQLVAEGYLEARTGSGTRVSWVAPARSGDVRRPRASGRQARIDLAPGLPDLRAFPRVRWAEALRAATASATVHDLGYAAPSGHPELRAVLVDYLQRSRAATASDARLMVTTSTSSARPTSLPGAGLRRAPVGCRRGPGWTRLTAAVRDSGLETVPVSVDDEGFRSTDLDAHTGTRAVLITPAHQFPRGVVLSAERRAALLRWADRVDGLILEDDYDAEFRYDRPPVSTMQGMNPRRVVLLGSLSKTLSPAIGIGWMLVPARMVRHPRPRRPDAVAAAHPGPARPDAAVDLGGVRPAPAPGAANVPGQTGPAGGPPEPAPARLRGVWRRGRPPSRGAPAHRRPGIRGGARCGEAWRARRRPGQRTAPAAPARLLWFSATATSPIARSRAPSRSSRTRSLPRRVPDHACLQLGQFRSSWRARNLVRSTSAASVSWWSAPS